jgi:hypothetical protein
MAKKPPEGFSGGALHFCGRRKPFSDVPDWTSAGPDKIILPQNLISGSVNRRHGFQLAPSPEYPVESLIKAFASRHRNFWIAVWQRPSGRAKQKRIEAHPSKLQEATKKT